MSEIIDLKPVERLVYSHYLTRLEKNSTYIKGLKVDGGERLSCPRCRKEQPGIEHGRSVRCPSCNLHMTVYGNLLEISDA